MPNIIIEQTKYTKSRAKRPSKSFIKENEKMAPITAPRYCTNNQINLKQVPGAYKMQLMTIQCMGYLSITVLHEISSPFNFI